MEPVHDRDVEANRLVVSAQLDLVPVLGRQFVAQPSQTPNVDPGEAAEFACVVALALAMLRKRKLMSGGRGPAFPDSEGGFRDPSNTSRDLREARGSEEFAWVTSDVFRKTAATELDRAGLSAREIADQLGHAKVSMTQDRYLGRRAGGSAAADALDRAHREAEGKDKDRGSGT